MHYSKVPEKPHGEIIMEENNLIKIIEEDLRLQHQESCKAAPGELDKKWEFLTSNEPKRFINEDLTLNTVALRNFRKLCIFIPDSPASDPSLLNIINLFSGGRRGSRRMLKECFDLVRRLGYLNLLKKYPSSRIGCPNIFHYKGYQYTFRWVRHIIFLGVFKEILGNKLKKGFATLDIGSSYGIFAYLLKNEFPHSHNVLLDFPEQLVLAYYFLGMTFPDAKIAGYKEISRVDKIDREFIEKYDFVLIPWFLYKNISPESIDLITNFASLGEMKREWFNYYLKSEPFLSTKYFFTVNRFQSAPTFDNDLTILDYPLNEFNKLHFRVSPYFSHCYTPKYFFLYEKFMFSSQYFEFIGERK